MQPFFQEPPTLGNTYAGDPVLRAHLQRLLPPDVLAETDPRLEALGAAAAGPLLAWARQAEAEPPRLVGYDPWGRRMDRIEVSPAWQRLHAAAVEAGLCAVAYDEKLGPHARVVQQALVHLYAPSSATYTCPVAMTDAAARVLLDHADVAVRDRVVPRLLARDVESAWTCGQWMTEREGGSDVGNTATTARIDADGQWRLDGVKWFTSATTADCALALARPVDVAGGGLAGSAGLGLFLVECVDPATGQSQLGRTILVNRLKDKLGTRSLPTAELTLHGTPATPVALTSGLRTMSGMLNVTRAHNTMNAAAGMRRNVTLAVAYSRMRQAFGRRLADLPLHRQTLAGLEVEAQAAFALSIRLLELLGRAERAVASHAEQRALRGLLPVAKLLTAKMAVAHASETLECFGGAGYVEDTGIPLLLRNAQVLPIWEGTTNVLSLDLLRAAEKADAVGALLDDLSAHLAGVDPPELKRARERVAAAHDGLRRAADGWETAAADERQAGMRAFALRLGRAYAGALLCAHATHRLATHREVHPGWAADRYTRRWLEAGWWSAAAGGHARTGALLAATHPGPTPGPEPAGAGGP